MGRLAFISREDSANLATQDDAEIRVIATPLDFERAFSSDNTVSSESISAALASKRILDRIGGAIEVRKINAMAMPDEELRRYVSHLQLRYQAAAGDAAYERYRATAPENLNSDRALLLAEMRTVLERLRLAYSVVHLRDCYLKTIRTHFLSVLAVELLVLVVVLARGLQLQSLWAYNFELVALAGLLGSTVSILRRSQAIAAAATFADDPVVQISALRYGDLGLYAALLSGPVFAIVLAMIFMSGLLSVEGLTPAFCTRTDAGCPGPHNQFWFLERGFSLKTSVDAAKLFVLCFVSGFAEQFVPDMLDRFAETASKK